MCCGSLYTPQLWVRFTQATMRKLTVAYHGILKKMLNLPRWTSNSAVFVGCKVPTFQETLRKSVFSFTKRISNYHDKFIIKLLNSELSKGSSLRKRWYDLIN